MAAARIEESADDLRAAEEGRFNPAVANFIARDLLAETGIPLGVGVGTFYGFVGSIAASEQFAGIVAIALAGFKVADLSEAEIKKRLGITEAIEKSYGLTAINVLVSTIAKVPFIFTLAELVKQHLHEELNKGPWTADLSSLGVILATAVLLKEACVKFAPEKYRSMAATVGETAIIAAYAAYLGPAATIPFAVTIATRGGVSLIADWIQGKGLWAPPKDVVSFTDGATAPSLPAGEFSTVSGTGLAPGASGSAEEPLLDGSRGRGGSGGSTVEMTIV